jgi:hypothetical protein
MREWKSVGAVFEGETIDVGGLNPWAFTWQRLPQEPVELPHPAYPSQRHRMEIYQIGGDNNEITFAAGELSAGVWGFYLLSDDSAP